MADPQIEKRSTRRFFLDLPIEVKYLNHGTYEVTGHTRDVSSHGAFFYVKTSIAVGTSIEFVLTLPSEITLTEPMRVRCRGKVVRVDKSARSQGVAVEIDKYDFVRSA